LNFDRVDQVQPLPVTLRVTLADVGQ